MKTLQQYILEYNTPDVVNLHKGKITLHFDNDGAFPFVINVETKVIVFGGEKSIHGDMFSFMSRDDFASLDLPDHTDMWNIRYCDDYGYQAKKGKRSHDSYNKWKTTMMKMYPYLYLENGNPKYMTGRIWDVPQVIGANDIKQYPEYKAIAVAWWGEIDGADYVDLTKYVIQEAEAEELIGSIVPVKDCTLFGVDNNGGVINLNKVRKVAKQTAASKEQQQLAQAIHLANQKEKDEFYKEFRKHRDEKNQTELYNHTKSKTEAEYRSIKYQESLEHETINEYLINSHITVNKIDDIKHCFVFDDNKINESNYEQYIKILCRTKTIRKSCYILKKDLYSFEAEDVIKALIDVYKNENDCVIHICYPMKNTNCGFYTACLLTPKTGAIENIDDKEFDDIEAAREVQNFFNEQ